ncbi:glycoside hydrolase [Phaffia rhodozyma]|uniref:non-reducing end alpha-L-arabinofuranosidase n=1 Tax=Phaffia rhodozyma TaxID=264483 RepID=A0A0F7SLE3_PHARH|nr:glycoside hydrolase [Phaffia rhodozyma]
MAGINPYDAPLTTASRTVASDEDITTLKNHPKYLPRTPIVVNSSAIAHDELVSPLLYSGFVEHLGRGIYGGIVDNPEAPSPDDLLIKQDGPGVKSGRLGWRKDVMKVIGKDGELQMEMLRWPGGNFVSNYHWQDGIGPIENRPVRMELAWLSTESNKFGTDEFIDYARALGVEPYLCLNMGTGTYEESLAWLEYCNGTGNTYWANLRRKNTGRNEPHNVKLWGLGNEMHGEWQVGKLSATDYTKQAARWAHGLKLVDPTIKLVSCGNQGNSEWDREVLAGLVDLVDYHSIHFYSMLGYNKESVVAGFEYEKNVFGPAAAERGIEICSSLIDLAKITKTPLKTIDPFNPEPSATTKRVKICYDEWNVWDEIKAPGSYGLEQTYDYTDALGVAAWLNVLVRKSREVGIACIAQSVNVISPLMTSPTGLLYQTAYFPLKLFARYMKDGHLLDLSFSSPLYKGPSYPHWIPHLGQAAYVDTAAVIVRSGETQSIRISVLNRHPELEWTGGFMFVDFEPTSVEIHELYHDDLSASNTFDNPTMVQPKVTHLSGSEWVKKDWVVKKHSWAFFIFIGPVRSA